ncbi:MAG: DNA mismatch repair endonuclease MutL [Firmicutes bacterium]|nr:DNA mismatch repair endonuclease MutL [Bacillota bacterium]
MPKIQILDSFIYNRIAAGEVVDAPSSVVKELIENSVDAGATEINIEIKNGGIDYISVSDNGCGIEKGDVKLAFERHATSKIKAVEDLDAIKSLGFRGEALSSIAAVASVKMVSRILHEDLGYTVHFDTGVLMDEGEIGANVGTSVKVENLFLNIPARRKYLKSASSEKMNINLLMMKMILANPDVAFKYIVDQKLIYQSDGKGVSAALVSVYGNETEYFFNINKTAPGMKINGFVSKPENSKSNKNHQTIIVNGRYVICNEISFAIHNALKDYIMLRRYPAYLIYIDIPFDMLDINVHPNKTEIKFIETKRIIGIIYHLIKDNIKAMFSNVSDIFDNSKNLFDNKHENIDLLEFSNFKLDANQQQLNVSNCLNLSISEQSNRFDIDLDKINIPAINDFVYDKDGLRLDNEIFTFKNLGTIFNTYIVIEKSSVLYLIDYHAAHERLLYNKFKVELEKLTPASQPLLIPYAFKDDINNYSIETLKKLGFDIKNNNIFAVPLVLYDIELRIFVREMASEDIKARDLTALDFIKDKIIRSACKAAVKSGDSLSLSEIEVLLKDMAQEEELCCPHGRPVIIKMTRRDIDKLFKRIV